MALRVMHMITHKAPPVQLLALQGHYFGIILYHAVAKLAKLLIIS